MQFVISIRKHSLSSQCDGEIIKPDTNTVYNIDRSKTIGGGRFEKLDLEKDCTYVRKWGNQIVRSGLLSELHNCQNPGSEILHIGLTVYNDNVKLKINLLSINSKYFRDYKVQKM